MWDARVGWQVGRCEQAPLLFPCKPYEALSGLSLWEFKAFHKASRTLPCQSLINNIHFHQGEVWLKAFAGLWLSPAQVFSWFPGLR